MREKTSPLLICIYSAMQELEKKFIMFKYVHIIPHANLGLETSVEVNAKNIYA